MGDKSQPCPQQRQKIPKDGWGPRGVPDCYYTSRVLKSTGRYVRFVNKLRIMEEEDRVGRQNEIKKAKEKEMLDFFSRCDRKNLINNVERRVNICLEAYQDDLKKKRKRLTEQLNVEEQADVVKLVEQVQARSAEEYQEKKDRLVYLLAKRHKERQEKYKAVPLGKCAHVLPCIFKIRAKEAQEAQLYQMREKQMHKMAEAEFDHMWYELAMKESEALAARMELDAIEQLRRTTECNQFNGILQDQRQQQRKRDQERLKQEYREMKARMMEDDRKEEEKQRQIKEKNDTLARERVADTLERKEAKATAKAAKEAMEQMWESLAEQVSNEETLKQQRRKQIEFELDTCNIKMVEMKQRIAETKFNSDPLIIEEGKRLQDAADLKRCQARVKRKNETVVNQKYIIEQAKQKRDEEEIKKGNETREEYEQLLYAQLDQLVKYKQLTDAQARKLHQNDLRVQIEYNRVLKERAKQEELEQRKKCQIARDEYQESIKTTLSSAFFSDEVHPFMKQMAKGVKMRWCPCARNNICAHSSEPTK